MTLKPNRSHLQIAWEDSHVGWIALEGCCGAWPLLGIIGLLFRGLACGQDSPKHLPSRLQGLFPLSGEQSEAW